MSQTFWRKRKDAIKEQEKHMTLYIYRSAHPQEGQNKAEKCSHGMV